MKILSIDLGTKKHGLAVSDSSETIASPLFSFNAISKKRDTNKILNTIIKFNEEKTPIGKIIIGLPKNLDGEDTDMTEYSRVFAKFLGNKLRCNRLADIKIEFQDETLTSREARRILVGQGVKDKREQKKNNRQHCREYYPPRLFKREVEELFNLRYGT